MKKEYTLIHPSIDSSAREIKAIVDLLSDQSELPNIAYRISEGGAVHRLTTAFTAYLSNVSGMPEFATRIASERGYSEIPLFVSAVGSATGAIYASLEAAGVRGGEVITASHNYLGVVNAIKLAGATPRFVDVDASNWCMNSDEVRESINSNTKAVILTHLNRFVDIEPYYDIIEKGGLNIPLIQDASLAIGSRLGGIRPGIINVGEGGTTIFSLATSKCLTGLGGALLTAHDQKLLERIVAISYQGMDPTKPGEIVGGGVNFKMNDMNAVIAAEQIAGSDEILDRRRSIKEKYDELLSPMISAGKISMQDVGEDTIVTHLGVLIPDRDRIANKLYMDHGIQIGMWHACHMYSAYGDKKLSLPVTEALAGRASFLPFHTALTDDDIEFICESLSEVL